MAWLQDRVGRYPLRQKVGDEAFDAIQRARVSRYEGESASTDWTVAPVPAPA
jgi:hypothetical protein